MRAIFCIIFLFLSCNCSIASNHAETEVKYYATGYASWYGGKFHSRKTASGIKFNKNHHTGAHRTLPFLSVVLVENLQNNTSEVILITDRGPFISKRILDISEQTAVSLGIKNQGLGQIKITYNPAITTKMLTDAGTDNLHKIISFFEKNRCQYKKMLLES